MGTLYSMTVAGRRDALRAGIAEPVITEGMTREECRAETDRWLDDCQAQSERLDEEHLLLGIGRTAAVCMTHEITWTWETATAGRWYLALPERFMTPHDLPRPDWDHRHYPHDEHGRIGRVTTGQRPETDLSRWAAESARAALAGDGWGRSEKESRP